LVAEQLEQHPSLQLGGRSLRQATGPHELEEQRLEVELLAAGRARRQVLAHGALGLGGQLAIEELVEVLHALLALHGGLPLMYPMPTAYPYSLACNIRRARNSRDFTVPTGTSWILAISW